METAQTDSDCKTKAKPDRDSNLRNETENATQYISTIMGKEERF